MRRKLILATCIASLAALCSLPAMAGHEDGGRYDYARVTDVRPVYETVRSHRPREVCWQEEAYVRERRAGPGGAILGALIGGALGRHVGDGTGQTIAIASGAVIGSQVGDHVARRRNPDRYHPVVEERCEIQHDYVSHQEIVAYDVTYRYNGKRYHTRLPYDPGPRLRVAVDVTPVD